MSRADPFAFIKALKSIGVNLSSAEGARPENIADRPRPMLRQLERQGFTVEAAAPSADIVKRFGFDVRTVFDVGVDTGTPLIYDAFPDAHFVLSDPVSESEDRVQHWKDKISFDFVHCALGASAGTADVKIPRRPNRVRASRASLADFEDGNAAMFEDFATRQIDVRQLDDVAADYAGPFGLMVDTEGFELEVIKGASETLKYANSSSRKYPSNGAFAAVIALVN